MSVNFTPPPGGPPKNFYQSNNAFTTASAGFDPATFDQRVIAWTIDSLLLVAVQKGLDTISEGSGSSFLSIITVLYFIFGHYFFECTAGKYFVGLRVHVDDESKKLGKIILRETIGRFLSAIVLGFGYLAIFFSRDRATWHDRISGTQVVSLHPVTSSTFVMVLRAFGAVILLTTAVTGYIAYSVLYSSAPLAALESFS